MRLFVAVELDRQVASAASTLTEELRQRAAKLAPRARITWIPPERLHLTVRFLGNADDDLTGAIRLALTDELEHPGFDLQVAGAGAFPRSGRPQVLWAGLTAGADMLRDVEREVSARLAHAGVPPENRDYTPHLTLARIRDAAGLRSAALFERLSDRTLGTTRVEAITLFESRLSPAGPTYVPLQRTALRSG